MSDTEWDGSNTSNLIYQKMNPKNFSEELWKRIQGHIDEYKAAMAQRRHFLEEQLADIERHSLDEQEEQLAVSDKNSLIKQLEYIDKGLPDFDKRLGDDVNFADTELASGDDACWRDSNQDQPEFCATVIKDPKKDSDTWEWLYREWARLACEDAVPPHWIARRMVDRIDRYSGLAEILREKGQDSDQCPGLVSLPEDLKEKLKHQAKLDQEERLKHQTESEQAPPPS
jgi:hypothetical protein